MILNAFSITTVFIAGIGSFFAPCVLPLLPVFLSYILGVSIRKNSKELLWNIALFVLGFSLVFTLLGAAAGGVGSIFREYTREIQIIGGIAMVVFGFQFLDIIRIPYLSGSTNVKLPEWVDRLRYSRSFLIGVLFAVTWSPCVGPVLGGVLSLAAASGTAQEGATLLLIYSLGISIPFVVVSLTLSSASKFLKLHKRSFVYLSKLSGIVLILFGLLLIANLYGYVNGWFLGIK